MAFSVGTLTAYVQQNADELLVKSILKARTVDLLIQEGTYMQGIKTLAKVAIMATDAIFQPGTGCTFTPSGTTTITQRDINVAPIKVVEDLCIADLDAGFMQQTLKKGYDNTLPFEAKYAEAKADTIAKQLEILTWQGDDDSLNANLAPTDGFIKIIDAAGTAIDANLAAYGVTSAPVSSGTGIVAANVKSIVNAMWLALPADIQGYDDIRIFCGWDVFYKYIAAYTDQNLFNFAPTGSEVSIENGVVIIPGTNYKLTAVHGLDGTNRLFSGRMYNFVVGTDLEHEEEQWKMMPDQFDNYLRFQAFFRFGVQVAFPDQIVSFKLT